MKMFVPGILLGILLIGCQHPQPVASKVTTKTAAIAAIYVPGGLGGYPYNDTIHDALKRAKASGAITFDNYPSKAIAEMEEILRRLSREGKYDAIVINGFQATEGLIRVAKEFPNQKYIGIEAGTDQEGTPHNLPNVASYTANYYEPMYAAGALAAMVTKTGTIGCVFSMDFKKYGSYIRAYEEGAKSVNPQIKVVWRCTGSYQEKPPKGKSCAEELLKEGADIVMNHTQAERTGVIEAVKASNTMLIGFNRESSLAPTNTIIDINRHQAEDVENAVASVGNGKFVAGTNYRGLVEGHYTVEFTAHRLITSDVRKKLDDLIAGFKSGAVKKSWKGELPEWKK